MRRTAAVLAAAFAGSLLVPLAAQSATAPTQTKRHAERNLLRATRMLARWHVGLVDPRTGLLRQNTTAACTGKGTRRNGGYHRFVCVLHHKKTTVRVLYVAQSGNGFEAHRLKR